MIYYRAAELIYLEWVVGFADVVASFQTPVFYPLSCLNVLLKLIRAKLLSKAPFIHFPFSLKLVGWNLRLKCSFLDLIKTRLKCSQRCCHIDKWVCKRERKERETRSPILVLVKDKLNKNTFKMIFFSRIIVCFFVICNFYSLISMAIYQCDICRPT